MADLSSFFSNMFTSNSLAPNAAAPVQAGQVTLTGAQLVTALKYLESIGVVKIANKTQAIQVSGVMGTLGIPVSQELFSAVLADAPNA